MVLGWVLGLGATLTPKCPRVFTTLTFMSDLNVETANMPTLFLIQYNTVLWGANCKYKPLKRDLANSRDFETH